MKEFVSLCSMVVAVAVSALVLYAWEYLGNVGHGTQKNLCILRSDLLGLS